METGKKIRLCRKQAGMSRDELAYRLGITEPEVAGWERGLSEPRPELLPAVCDALGITMQELEPSIIEAAAPEAFQDASPDFDGSVSLKIVTPVEELLEKGEHLIWAGKPSVKLRMGAAGSRSVQSIVWIAVTSIWFIGSAYSFPPLMLLGVPVLLFGIYRTISGVLSVKKQKELLSYAVTDRRVIIRSDYGEHVVKSIYLSDIRSIRFAEGPHNTGTIILSDREYSEDNGAYGTRRGYPQMTQDFFKSRGKVPLDGLYDIPDVNKVCDIFRSLLE